MGIYIKDMKMPKGCHETPHGYVCPYILYCKAYTRNKPPINKRPSNCPLVEVRTPHGRLIDVDEVEAQVELMQKVNGKDRGFMDVALAFAVAPTVIESEDD